MIPVPVQCPYCFTSQHIWLAYDDVGSMYYDCPLCCRPWLLYVWLDEVGEICVSAEACD